MKNSQSLTAYLDHVEQVQRPLHLRLLDTPGDSALFDQWLAATDEAGEIFQACRNAGWTITEIDAAYERRFGYKVNR